MARKNEILQMSASFFRNESGQWKTTARVAFFLLIS